MAAGRFAAWKNGARLITAPAPLADAGGFTDQVVVKDKGRQRVLGSKAPDLVLLDHGLIWSRPEPMTRQAVGEVLAIVTAVEEWRRAGAFGRVEYHEETASAAQEIVNDLFDRADDIFDLTPAGIRALAEAMRARERLAVSRGHRRMVEGPEHLLADGVEVVTGKSFPRGGLLALCTILIMELQHLNSRPAKQFLHWVQAPWKPEQLKLDDRDLAAALARLAQDASESETPSPSLRAEVLTETEIERIIAGMREPILRSSLMDRKDRL
jgi:glycerol dehydrogenase-like iron-containing ADH family enzyme